MTIVFKKPRLPRGSIAAEQGTVYVFNDPHDRIRSRQDRPHNVRHAVRQIGI